MKVVNIEQRIAQLEKNICDFNEKIRESEKILDDLKKEIDASKQIHDGDVYALTKGQFASSAPELRMVVISNKQCGIMYLHSSQYCVGKFVTIKDDNVGNIENDTMAVSDVSKYINDCKSYKYIGNIHTMKGGLS